MVKAPLLESLENGILTLTLNRPEKLNAYDLRLLVQLQQSIERNSEREDVRVIILTGAGNSFCGGADIQRIVAMARDSDQKNFRRMLESFKQVLIQLTRVPQVTIAAINGAACDGGLNLGLACDLRLISDKACFGYPFGQIGLGPEIGTSLFLPELLGPNQAMELLFSGRIFTSAEAAKLGLFRKHCPDQSILEEVIKLADGLLASPPVVLRNVKRTIQASRKSMEKLLDLEIDARTRSFLSSDFLEGIDAFENNRRPRFRGE